MKPVIALILFFSSYAFSNDEYEWDSAYCAKDTNTINECYVAKYEFYKNELSKLTETRKSKIQEQINRYEGYKELDRMSEYRLYILNRFLNKINESNEQWEKYIISDCNTLTSFDLPEDFKRKYPGSWSYNRSSVKTYYSCLSYHTEKRVHELRPIVYCTENGGCGYVTP